MASLSTRHVMFRSWGVGMVVKEANGRPADALSLAAVEIGSMERRVKLPREAAAGAKNLVDNAEDRGFLIANLTDHHGFA
jgi:hypothetical protein